MSPEIALERAKQRSTLDRFEREPMDFHIRIRQIYKNLAAQHSDRFEVIDSSLDFKQVKEQVINTISNFLDE